MLMLVSKMIVAQQVNGFVLDEEGKPLQGANIICSSLNSFSVSREDGSFTLELVPNTNDSITIIFSYIGYKSLKRTIHNSNSNNNIGKVILLKKYYDTDAVSVVATRNDRNTMRIPANITIVNSPQMELIASDKIDQNLKFVSGITIDRPFGIFGKSVVGIRSIVSSSPGRQLTLLDGVPINKSDGGGTNWNRIIESDIQQIEVLKGPSAAIYGNNAMGGIINMISKRPISKAVLGSISASYSSCNTFSADFNLMQKIKDNTNSFYYTIAAKGVSSNGYNTVPDSIIQETDTAVFLQEYGFNSRLGYLFGDSSRLEINYNFYDENRGQGTKIKLEDGAVAKYKTNFSSISFSKQSSRLKIDISLFYQLEKYERDIEKQKKGIYSYIKVNSDRNDFGGALMFNYSINKHKLNFGFDVKMGSVYGIDAYQTSTDRVINKGKMDVANVYFNDEWQLFRKLKAIMSLHYAYGKFYDGAFLLEDYTSQTNFMLTNAGSLRDKYWGGFSPRLALQYDISNHSNIYSVYSHGYRAPNLDDLTRFGFINIGYKNANPNLLPEKINNIELGYRLKLKKWEIETNVNFSQGTDFMYYVATGETIFGGRKKVYEKQNISSVDMFGGEICINYYPVKKMKINTNYSLNKSKIISFESNNELLGKRLSYVPNDIANFSISYFWRNISSGINFHYQGSMYIDEANYFEINPLMSLDFNVIWEIYKKFSLKISAQNIFNEQHMVSTDQVSLGRYLSIELAYKIR